MLQRERGEEMAGHALGSGAGQRGVLGVRFKDKKVHALPRELEVLIY